MIRELYARLERAQTAVTIIEDQDEPPVTVIPGTVRLHKVAPVRYVQRSFSSETGWDLTSAINRINPREWSGEGDWVPTTIYCHVTHPFNMQIYQEGQPYVYMGTETTGERRWDIAWGTFPLGWEITQWWWIELQFNRFDEHSHSLGRVYDGSIYYGLDMTEVRPKTAELWAVGVFTILYAQTGTSGDLYELDDLRGETIARPEGIV